jgi:hypothetical protein
MSPIGLVGECKVLTLAEMKLSLIDGKDNSNDNATVVDWIGDEI